MKLNKRLAIIYTACLYIVGILFLAFSRSDKVLTFFALLFIGGGFLFLAKVIKFQYQENLINLDKKVENILKDIEIYKEQSEYYEKVDGQKADEILRKFIKKNKYRYILFNIFGGIILVTSFFVLI